MSVENNKTIARRWNEALGNRTFDAFGEFLHAEYRNHSGTENGPWTTMIRGLDNAKTRFAELFKENPGVTVTVEDIVAEGDKVAVRETLYVNGRPSAHGISMYRFADGKIVDDWFAQTPIE